MSVKKLCDRCPSDKKVKTYKVFEVNEETGQTFALHLHLELCDKCYKALLKPRN
jgi:hypothetical protein